jgi:hypothetical protein
MGICALMPLWLAACSQKQVTTKSAVEVVVVRSDEKPMWKKRFDRYSSQIKDGMTQDDVIGAIGKPDEERRISGVNSYNFWLYNLGHRIMFQVMFDKNNKVSFTRLYS